MPIVISTVPTPPGGGGGTGGGGIPGVVVPPPWFTASWRVPSVIITDVGGRQVVFGGEGTHLLMRGAQGLGTPNVQLFSNPLPDGDGSAFRGVRYAEKDVFLPVTLFGRDYETLRDLRYDLEDLLDPKRGPVTITVVQPGGGQMRSATGWHTAGMEGSTGADEFGLDWQTLGLTFRLLDPMWSGPPVTHSFSPESAMTGFLSTSEPFFPASLSASQIIGTATIRNDGDSDSYPVWTIKGPGDGFTALNVTTGKQFTIAGAISSARTVTVDTRRHVQDVTDDLGGNLWPRLSAGSALWPLTGGAQTVTLTFAGSTAASRVTATVTPRYRSGL